MKVPMISNNDAAQQMAHFEQQHGLVLPQQYKSAIVQGRLGQYRHWQFEFVGADGFENSTNVDTFFSFSRDDNENVLTNYEFYVVSGRAPRHAVPIGHCIAGNLICLDMRLERLGAVAYWDHELELELDADDVLAALAPDLQHFLNMLQPDD